jgi:hypothetical protein
MPTAAIMKDSKIIRALLVFAAISLPYVAVILSAKADVNIAAPDINTYRPLHVIFPGLVQRDLSQRPEGHRGFAGFVQEIRSAVRSTGGAPRATRARDRSFSQISVASQTTDPTYETSIPMRVGNKSRTGETAEVFLGFSVRQILNDGPHAGTITGERRSNKVGNNRNQTNRLSSASIRRGSLSTGRNWFSGGFLSAEGSFTMSGFGLDLQPLRYPNDLGNGPYLSPHATDLENSKGLIALRKMVLDFVFNPFVYFTVLVISVYMFMARFRSS